MISRKHIARHNRTERFCTDLLKGKMDFSSFERPNEALVRPDREIVRGYALPGAVK